MAMRIPIDLDSVKPGHRVEPSQIESWTGEERGTNKYDLKVLAYVQEINRHFQQHHEPMLAVVVKGAIEIKESNGMVTVGANRMQRALNSLTGNMVMLSRVDAAKLNEKQAKLHDRTTFVGSRLLMAYQDIRTLRRAGGEKERLPPPAWLDDSGAVKD